MIFEEPDNAVEKLYGRGLDLADLQRRVGAFKDLANQVWLSKGISDILSKGLDISLVLLSRP